MIKVLIFIGFIVTNIISLLLLAKSNWPSKEDGQMYWGENPSLESTKESRRKLTLIGMMFSVLSVVFGIIQYLI